MTDVEKVRLKIGDTNVTAALFSDTEIEYFLEEEAGNVAGAAAAACEALAARFSTDVDVTTDDQSLKRSQRAAAFAKRAEDLREQAEKNAGIGTVTTQKIDGYNDTEVGNEDIEGEGSAGGRVRQGYVNPDRVP